MRCLNGGWSYTWQGSKAEDLAEKYNTIYEALCNKFGKENIILEQGVTYNEQGAYYEENAPQIGRAVSAAAGADVIVACIGENSYCETPGNLTDLWLSGNQRQLVKELAKTGKPIVLVLNEGRPRLIADIEPLARNMMPLAEQRMAKEQFEDVAYFVPFYLKDFVAKAPKDLLGTAK
jgi:beta-glucosidase